VVNKKAIRENGIEVALIAPFVNSLRGGSMFYAEIQLLLPRMNP